MVEGKKGKTVVSQRTIHKYLGPEKFSFGMAEEKDEVGVVDRARVDRGRRRRHLHRGDADAGQGRRSSSPGSSATSCASRRPAAVSYIRTRASELGIAEDFQDNTDLHIHVPAAAIPKDGPSAGITMATAIASVLTGCPVRRDVAMTGEITLRGRVLPIGGLKEKLLAAHRAGLKTVLIPKENVRDLELLPEHVRERTGHRARSRRWTRSWRWRWSRGAGPRSRAAGWYHPETGPGRTGP